MKSNISILFISFLILLSCGEDDMMNNLVGDPNVIVFSSDHELDPDVGSVNLKFTLVRASTGATNFDLVKRYENAAGTMMSASVVLDNYPLNTNDDHTDFEFSVTIEELRSDIVFDGGPLTNDDYLIEVGSQWELSFVPKDDNGNVLYNEDVVIDIEMISPFAGEYEVINSEYYLMGNQNLPWNGTTRTITIVEGNTLAHPGFLGRFAYLDPTDQFSFSYNQSTNAILIPHEVNGVSQPITTLTGYFITCENPGDGTMADVQCETSNIIIPDTENGEHTIKLSYGFYVGPDGGMVTQGARQFYEELRKIVQ